mgnify:FL=1
MSLIDDLYFQATGLLDPRTPDFNPSTDKTGQYNPMTGEIKNPDGTLVRRAKPGTFTPQDILGGKRGPMPPNDIEAIGKDPGMFQRIFGITPDQAKANWKDKGGFEGLMANPGFLLGLGIMQSSAQGKSVGEGLFDNAVKAGAISQQYADRIKARGTILGPITEAQRSEIEAVLEEKFIGKPGFIRGLKLGNQKAKYREALDLIAAETDKELRAMKAKGKTVRFDREAVRRAMKRLEAQGKIDVTEAKLFNLIGGTVQAREMGGPVKAGKPYLVGEKGPEVMIPQQSGKITSNDDSRVFNMLMDSNPQLKGLSRQRAEKILKSRFPDYF